jgi:hypothetical protein
MSGKKEIDLHQDALVIGNLKKGILSAARKDQGEEHRSSPGLIVCPYPKP